MLTQVATDGTTVRTLKQLTQVDVDGTTIRNLKELWQNDSAGTPQLIYKSFTALATPATVNGYVNSFTPKFAITDPATANVTGGTAPFTYAWTIVGTGFTALSPTSATTTFKSTPLGPGDEVFAAAYVTVTDAVGAVDNSNNVDLYANNFS